MFDEMRIEVPTLFAGQLISASRVPISINSSGYELRAK